jgi:low temperature requirement protein LtrA
MTSVRPESEWASLTADADEAVDEEHSVRPIELFFDLVFVFAITQVTRFMAQDPTWDGLGDGLLVLAVVWWAWVGYSWLTNEIDPEATRPRLVIFVAMAAMLIASLAIPDAFGAYAAIFVGAVVVVRVMHILLYALATNDSDVRVAVLRFAPGVAVSMGLLALSTGFDGPAQSGLFLCAIVLDALAPLTARNLWRVHASHFAERHGLIIIIAFGESIVAIGVGAEEVRLDLAAVTAAVLGVAAAGALWWAYFDVAAIVAERVLSQATGAARVAMARDSFSYLHFVMVAGIVLFALGMKKALGHVEAPLAGVGAVALCGGPALFLGGHVLFRLRNTRTWSHTRPVAMAVLLAAIPIATQVSGLAGLAAVAAILVALIAYEAFHWREGRARIRHLA